MEIKRTWISKQFNHGYMHHSKYYTTSLSCSRGDGKVWEECWVGQLSSPTCAVHGPGPRPWGPLEVILVLSLQVFLDLLQGSFSGIPGVSHVSMQSLSSIPEVLLSACLQDHLSEHLLCVSSQKPLPKCAPRSISSMCLPQKPLPTCFP